MTDTKYPATLCKREFNIETGEWRCVNDCQGCAFYHGNETCGHVGFSTQPLEDDDPEELQAQIAEWFQDPNAERHYENGANILDEAPPYFDSLDAIGVVEERMNHRNQGAYVTLLSRQICSQVGRDVIKSMSDMDAIYRITTAPAWMRAYALAEIVRLQEDAGRRWWGNQAFMNITKDTGEITVVEDEEE